MESEIGENESVSTAVVRAVSAVKGLKPSSLQPLDAVIEPDALDALFDPQSDDGSESDRDHSFSYSGCNITIENSTLLTIDPVETTDRPASQSTGTTRTEKNRLNRDTEQTTAEKTPESRICMVCQQPINQEDLERVRGEIVHHKCHSEARCGIWLDR